MFHPERCKRTLFSLAGKSAHVMFFVFFFFHRGCGYSALSFDLAGLEVSRELLLWFIFVRPDLTFF